MIWQQTKTELNSNKLILQQYNATSLRLSTNSAFLVIVPSSWSYIQDLILKIFVLFINEFRVLCLLQGMGLKMFGKVVTPHETLSTVRADEALLPSVCTEMPLQLVWPGETLPAEKPVTDEGSFPRVPPEMSFQMWCLAVHLTTPRDVADVFLSLGSLPGVTGVLTVGTPASSASSGCKLCKGWLMFKESGVLVRRIAARVLVINWAGIVA